jgi:hypothetical protein
VEEREQSGRNSGGNESIASSRGKFQVNSISQIPAASRQRRDSGGTVNFDDDLIPLDQASDSFSIPSNIQDILSPISKCTRGDENVAPANVGGTLRISAPNAPTKSGYPPPLAAFIPSALGKRLGQVFNNSVTPHDIGAQKRMIDEFIIAAKSPIDFADEQHRMPAIVFCLRGIIRFGNGEIGATYRTEYSVPYLVSLISGRHTVCETGSSIEAVECACTVLGTWAIHPLGKTSPCLRPSFEPVLRGSNCLILQQLVGALMEQFPKWISMESSILKFT